MGKKIINDEGSNTRITTKARYWTAVGYTDNMRDDWQEVIANQLQYPYVYCIHDKDKQGDGDDRKTHVHIVVAYGNTTTYKTALALFRKLNKEGCEAFNTCQPVANIRYMYDYLIHDTEDSKKKGKYPYDKSERITGNNFDIGAFEQVGTADKKRMRRELGKLIYDHGFTNYLDFYFYVCNNFDSEYEDVICSYSGHFARLVKGSYQRKISNRFEQKREAEDSAKEELEREEEFERLCKSFKCVHVGKYGTTVCNPDGPDACEKCEERFYCGFVNGFEEDFEDEDED